MLNILALLVVVLLVAKFLAGYAETRKIPPVIAELGIGIVLGNLGGWPGFHFAALESSDAVRALSELGLLFLLFHVGLETDLVRIRRVGREALLAAVIGVVAPVALAGFSVHLLFPMSSWPREMFVASALCATSVGISARIFRDAGVLSSASGQIVLGAAVIDDVLGIIVLALASAVAMQGAMSWSGLLFLLAKILAFGVLFLALRRKYVAEFWKWLRRFQTEGTVTMALLGSCVLASWIAERAGLTGIIGAFAAGVLFEEAHFRGYRETETTT
ncbi:MAG: cation:proton antiporter, partial [Bdellovibrionota bacterium]